MDKILEYLNSNGADIINELKQIVELESPTHREDLNDKLCAYLENKFSDYSITKRIECKSYGDILKAQFGEGERQILVLCHMDTVCKEGTILERPFTIKSDKIFGPGVYDMKFGIIQAYYVIKTLSELKIELENKRLVVLINADEEIGSKGSRVFIENEAKNSECVFVLEPPQSGSLITGRKGIARFYLKIYGKAAHSGANHKEGVSSIKELAHKIIELESMTNYDEDITVNVGIIKGGDTANTVPDYAEAIIDVRFSTKSQGEEYKDKILNIKPHDKNVILKIEGGITRPPMEENEGNITLFNIAKEVGESIGLELHKGICGSGSDGNYTSSIGISTLDGLGALGDGAHAEHEHILKIDIIKKIELLTKLIIKL